MRFARKGEEGRLVAHRSISDTCLRRLREVQIRSDSELCIPVKVHSFALARHRHTSCATLSTLHSQVLENALRMLSWVDRGHMRVLWEKTRIKAATPQSATLSKQQLLQSNSFESASSVSCLPECPTPDIAAADEPGTAQCPSFVCPNFEAHLCFHMNSKA